MLYMSENDTSNYNSYMIVYEKNQKRAENFKKINEITNCQKFSAIDTINEYEKYVKFALENNYTDQAFINNVKHAKGRLGCNLSHQLLLKRILNESLTDWNLILEDDVVIKDYDVEKINHIIKKADENESHYIQLYSHPMFKDNQQKTEKIDENLFKIIPQWGTVAYIINKKAIKMIVNEPMCGVIDCVITDMKKLNSLCYLNTIFDTGGSRDMYHHNNSKTEFGSLLW